MSVSIRARQYSPSFHAVLGTLLSLILILNMLITPTPAHADAIQTVGDFLSLGANTVRELQETIRLLGDTAPETLKVLEQSLSAALDQISDTYQNNLNITLASLDSTTRNKILELEAVMNRVNAQLQEDIMLVSQQAQVVIADASLEAKRLSSEISDDLKNVMVVGGETAVFVIDRTANNIVVIISIVMLGIGLLVFALSFRRKGKLNVISLLLMLLYVAIFVTLVFVPEVRAFAMSSTGMGLGDRLKSAAPTPRVFAVRPDPVILGETSQIEIWGNHLLNEGNAPTARLAGSEIQMKAFSEDLIVLNAVGLSGATGSTNVELIYPDEVVLVVVNLERPAPVLQPADLVITNFYLDPSSPQRLQNVTATIEVTNYGETEAKDFYVLWQPRIDAVFTTTSDRLTLAPKKSLTISLTGYSYQVAQSLSTLAKVDSSDTVSESNENNNTETINVTVRARRASIAVKFDRVTVIDDANDFGCTGIWMTFTVNTQSSSWGSKQQQQGFCDGTQLNPSKDFTVTLSEGETLYIRADGRRAHAGFEGDVQAVTTTYQYNNDTYPWGGGTGSQGRVYTLKNDRNTNGGFEYEVEYRIIFQGWLSP